MTAFKAKRIFWSRDERDLVTERMAELIRSTPGMKAPDLLDNAQDVLDDDRRRPVNSNSVFLLKPLFQEAQKRAQVANGQAKEPEPTVETVVQYVPVPTPLDIATVPTHELLAAAILRVMALMKPEPLAVSIGGAPASVAPPLRQPITPKVEDAPRVGVVGLFKDQFNHLKARVNQKKVELVWIDKDLAHNSMPERLAYVLVQRHTSHRHFTEAREAFGSDRVVFVDGGITQCAEKLAAQYPGCLN
jgi:hypothetical protein